MMIYLLGLLLHVTHIELILEKFILRGIKFQFSSVGFKNYFVMY